MGIVGMKVYLRGLVRKIPWSSSLSSFLRFALSQPISTAVIGCDSVAQLEENVEYAKTFHLMSEEEQTELTKHIAPVAGQLMYYKP
jgi:predicted aldo/keto reductase-like oxidoreductase